MAEWGKGDGRWIVDNRVDGANVNQWHWSEKDCLPWSRSRLTELFMGVPLVQEGSATAAHVVSVDAVEGEAFLNVRKKKLIPSYEISLKMSFSASLKKTSGGESASVSGKVCANVHNSDHSCSLRRHVKWVAFECVWQPLW
jgi:activator of HSP90 ATPase